MNEKITNGRHARICTFTKRLEVNVNVDVVSCFCSLWSLLEAGCLPFAHRTGRTESKYGHYELCMDATVVHRSRGSAMSESLKSWLFTFTASQASVAQSAMLDLCDLPFLSGNRVQLLRFLTYPASSKSACDIYALVGDRTHCIAARFGGAQIARFHSTHAPSFTSLKGALLTLTNVRITVAQVRVHTSMSGAISGGYYDGQWALVLDVRGWEVVSSIKEPVWFSGVKLVTSENLIPEGQEQMYRVMVAWMKRWIRYEILLRKANQRHIEASRIRALASASASASAQEKSADDLPTPAQRNGTVAIVVPSSPAPIVVQASPTQDDSLASSSISTTQQRVARQLDCEREAQVDLADTNRTLELWSDFNLDATVDDIALDGGIASQWTLAPAAAAAQVAHSPSAHALCSQPPPQKPRATRSESADLDPNESGISDYERQSRRDRRTSKRVRRSETTDVFEAAESVTQRVLVQAQPADARRQRSKRTSQQTLDDGRVLEMELENVDSGGTRAHDKTVVGEVQDVQALTSSVSVSEVSATTHEAATTVNTTHAHTTSKPHANVADTSTATATSTISANTKKPSKRRLRRQAAIAAL